MQELRSDATAVRQSLEECRELEGQCADIKNNLEELKVKQELLTTRKNDAEASLSELQKKQAGIKKLKNQTTIFKTFKNLFYKLDLSTKPIKDLKQTLELVDDQIKTKEKAVAGYQSELNKLEGQIQNLEKALTSQSGVSQAKQNAVDAKLSRLKNQAAALHQNISTDLKNAEALTHLIADGDAQIGLLSQDIASLTNSMTELHSELAELQAQKKSIEQEKSEVSLEIKTYAENEKTIRQDIATINHEIEGVEKNVLEIENTLGGVKEQIEQEKLHHEEEALRKTQNTKVQSLYTAAVESSAKLDADMPGIKQVSIDSISGLAKHQFGTEAREAALAQDHDLAVPLGDEKALLEHAKVSLRGPEQPKPSPTLSREYEIDGTKYGKEVITRDRILLNDIAYSENMLKLLQDKLENGTNLTPGEKQQIQKDVSYYATALKEAKEFVANKRDWVDSGYFRTLISDCESFGAAIQKYISAPVNMRYQELQNAQGEKVSGFYRVGVISDMRNGWVSLKELKEMQGDPKKIDARIQEIQTYLLKNKKKLNSNQKQSAAYALQQLNAVKSGGIEGANLIIEDRRRALQKQMVQLVVAQVGQNPKKIQKALSSGTFNMTHVCLLNQSSKKVDPSGWVHDERIEIEDMAEIFAEFQGKTLVFDGKGPSLEGDAIHMPSFDFPFEAPKEVKLSTFMVNVSVQGDIKNNKLQYALNATQLARMKKEGLISLEDKSVRNMLDPKKKSGYKRAEEFLVHLLEKDDMAVSIGCLSAKDRTGAIGARACQHFLGKELPKGTENPYESQILKEEGLAHQVVVENGHGVLKVDPRTVKNLPKSKWLEYGSRAILNAGKKLDVDGSS